MLNTKIQPGDKYGLLTVIERVENEKNGQPRWKCKCDCGNEIIARGSRLRNGEKTHCGCQPRYNFIDETGNIYGKLTVIKQAQTLNNNKSRNIFWECQCECGNIIIVNSNHLRQGLTTSCGCLQMEYRKNFGKQTLIDITDQKFGKLTAIKHIGHKHGNALWECKCDCGNIIITASNNLRNNITQSCGCINSINESKILNFLQKNNINYKKEYYFSDLKSEKNSHYRFDFAIFDKNNNLQFLIEYQGIQHFKDFGNFGKQQREVSDKIKYDYCKNNNIKLEYINYNQDLQNRLQEIFKNFNINNWEIN